MKYLETGFHQLLNSLNDLKEIDQWILFISIGYFHQRALVVNSFSDTFAQSLGDVLVRYKEVTSQIRDPVAFHKIDIVVSEKTISSDNFSDFLAQYKRNYFPLGVSFDQKYKKCFLAGELLGNSCFYKSSETNCVVNDKNWLKYMNFKYRSNAASLELQKANLSVFKTISLISHKSNWIPIEFSGRYAGYRKFEKWNAETVFKHIYCATTYLSSQVNKHGKFFYGRWSCFNRPIPTYNTLRHFSSVYALWDGWSVTNDNRHKKAALLATRYGIKTYIKKYSDESCFVLDENEEIKLGGISAAILAFAKEIILTKNQSNLPLIHSLIQGLHYLGKRTNGAFNHVINSSDLSLKDEFRTIYYDGEILYALMMAYKVSSCERYLEMAQELSEIYISEDYWKTHDHWLAYGFGELFLQTNDPKYLHFIQLNINGHFEFIRDRITTYPTLLELCMATYASLNQYISSSPQSTLLFNLDDFKQAMHMRARYLLNGFFYPEIAMYMKKPSSILNSFFIRHHGFRSRIDDNEHYISGLSNYYIQTFFRPKKSPDNLKLPRMRLLIESPGFEENIDWALAMESSIGLAIRCMKGHIPPAETLALQKKWIALLPSPELPEGLTSFQYHYHINRPLIDSQNWQIRDLADYIFASSYRSYAITNSSDYWNGTHFKCVPVGVPRTKNISPRARNYTPHRIKKYSAYKDALVVGSEVKINPGIYLRNTTSGCLEWHDFNEFEFQQIVLTATDEKNWLHTRVQDLDYGWSIVEAIYRYYNSHIAVYENLGIVGCFMIDMLSQIHWWLSHLMPYRRGSAAISDMLIRSLFESRGVVPGPWRPGVLPDVEALVTPLEKYIEQYKSLFCELDFS